MWLAAKPSTRRGMDLTVAADGTARRGSTGGGKITLSWGVGCGTLPATGLRFSGCMGSGPGPQNPRPCAKL